VAHAHNSRKDGRLGLFTGTADDYVRYRPQYPPELIDRLVAAAGLAPSARVLDLGSGPGHVALPMAERVAEVVAVDPEAEMLAEIHAPNVRTVLGRAEDVDADWGRFDLVTAGRSFHWFDRAVMFERLPQITDRLALLGDSMHQSAAASAALEIAAEMLGEPRPSRGRWFADVLRASPFPEVEEMEVDDERVWDADRLVGLVRSTSYAPRLGPRLAEVERRIRETFGEREVREVVTVGAVLGRRRDQ
jgi:SAM-dependent methyltransferase